MLMRWECSECGSQIERDRAPVLCSECGIAGVLFVAADESEFDGAEDALRDFWFRAGFERAQGVPPP
jgi:hypothetical protein